MDINLLTEQEAATLREMIAASQRIVICCHKSPDGDAIGSSLGWYWYLRSLGKEAQVCIPDAMPDFLAWLPENQKMVRYDKHPEQVKQTFDEADLVFCLDFSRSDRVDEMKVVLTSTKAKMVVIDHHLAPELDAALMVSYPELSSSCEMVFRLVWQLGGFEQVGKEWATCVYCGMMTDTGGFVYNSNDPSIYFIISQLLTKGINKDKIYRNVFNTYSPWAIKFRGYLMGKKLKVYNDLHCSYYTVSRSEMRRFHFIKGDLEGLVNEPLRIKGMKFSVSLREDTDRPNLILVSLRSVEDFPCNKVAEEFFNGGGHRNASGGRLYCSLTEAKEVVLKAFEAYADLLR